MTVLAGAGALFYFRAPPQLLLKFGLQRPYTPRPFWARDASEKWKHLPGCAGRPVFLYLWFSDCPGAQQNLAWVNKMHERYKDSQLCFETVSTDDSEVKLRKFAKDNGIDYPVYWGRLPDELWPETTPWLYLIDRSGRVRKQTPAGDYYNDQIDAWIQDQLWDGSPEAAIPMRPPPPEVLAEKAEATDLENYTQRLLSLSAFDDLDALADRLRSTKARFKWGQWQLARFYSAIDEDLTDDDSYERRLDVLKRWAAAKPGSVTARVALAEVFTSYAWRARGAVRSGDESPESWKPYQDRLAQANQALTEAAALPAKCPELYAQELLVAAGEQWNRADVDAAFAAGKALEPGYTRLYRMMAWYLCPSWYGERGEWERFAERSAENAALPDGMGLYARIAWKTESTAVDRTKPGTLFTQTAVSWPKMRQGFLDIDKAAPGSWVLLNAFARYACLAGAAATARDVFARLGDRYDPAVWGDSFEYGRWKLWAQGKMPRPDPKELSL